MLERVATDALVMEPRELYDRAIVGLSLWPGDHWPRRHGWVCVYSFASCVELLVEDGAEYFEALDHTSCNSAGLWAGPFTWTFYPLPMRQLVFRRVALDATMRVVLRIQKGQATRQRY